MHFRTAVILVGLLLAPGALSAQRAPAPRAALKHGLPVIAPRAACPAAAAPSRAATATERREAREAAQRAQQSAILGDRAAALDQLKQAARLDPADAGVSYQLARAQEGAGATDAAAAEYCRFLALAPSAPEAGEARERVTALSRSVQATVSNRVLAPFRSAIVAFEAGRMAQAELGFTEAIRLQGDWAEAYYNRALARAARGATELAVADLQQYLRYKPEAEDRSAVVTRIAALRGGPLSASTALSFGLVLPGAGQFYTGRKMLGLLPLGAASVAVAYAVKTDPVMKTTEETAIDPFGNPYTFTVTRSVLGRPYLAPGLAAAGAIAAASAVEAFIYARRLNAREQRVSVSVLPSTDGVALRLSVR